MTGPAGGERGIGTRTEHDRDAGLEVRAKLATLIGETLRQRGLTQTDAAEILGIPQPAISGMLRGRLRGISEARLIDCLNRLGWDVDLVVRKTPRSRGPGRTRVVSQ